MCLTTCLATLGASREESADPVVRLPQATTFMPSGLEKGMTRDELIGLVEYLVNRRDKPATHAVK